MRLFEQAKALSEIGAGLHISPNGMHVMRALGVSDALRPFAARPQAIATRHYASGEINYEGMLDAEFESRFGAPFFSFHRADLHRVLSAAAAEFENIEILLGHRLLELKADQQRQQLKFEHKRVVTSECVVGADGVHSKVRQHIHGEVKTNFTGHVAYRGMVASNSPGADQIEPKLNIWVGPGKHVVAYPVRAGELINYVAIVEQDDWQDESWTSPAAVSDLHASFSDWHNTVRLLLEQSLAGEGYKWALLGRAQLPSWSCHNITLLGDAAHPMVPYLAQGAVMAIEDAWVLAACLAGHDDLDAGLRAYQNARLQRTSDIQAAAWQQGQLNHAKKADDFRGGQFADPGWIYGVNVVSDYPLD